MQIVASVYSATRQFPKEESFGLTAQIRRSAVSVPSNIAEGYVRNSDNELIRFLNITAGSLYELQTQLEIAKNINYLNAEEFHGVYANTREIEVMLVSLINKVKQTNKMH